MLTDHQLIAQYVKGDEKALEVLIARHMSAMYRFVFGYVKNADIAEDVTQEVFLKVWRNIRKIKKEKNFKSWLYTVAKNTALDFLKKKKSVPFSAFETQEGKNMITETVADGHYLPIELSEMLENKSLFLGAIDQLSEKYRLVLSLYYYEYFNFREIAERLQEPINTIKSRHRRGLTLLREVIKHKI